MRFWLFYELQPSAEFWTLISNHVKAFIKSFNLSLLCVLHKNRRARFLFFKPLGDKIKALQKLLLSWPLSCSLLSRGMPSQIKFSEVGETWGCLDIRKIWPLVDQTYSAQMKHALKSVRSNARSQESNIVHTYMFVSLYWYVTVVSRGTKYI